MAQVTKILIRCEW